MPNSSSHKRMKLSLFLAIAIHALGIISFGFSYAKQHEPAASIEVTLAKYQAPEPLVQADYFAQIDQLGSGEAAEKRLISDAEQALLADTDQQQPQDSPSAEQTLADQAPEEDSISHSDVATFDVIISVSAAQRIAEKKPDKETPSKSSSTQDASLAEQIASLNTQIQLRHEMMAKAPKKRIISTASTKSHQDAAYLENWRRRIVSVGNTHYPKAANEQKIYGRVRLIVAILANGQVKSIEILESSGKKILDHSAIKIIRLASPFEPFSALMRKNTDILEIIRTIEFEKTTHIY